MGMYMYAHPYGEKLLNRKFKGKVRPRCKEAKAIAVEGPDLTATPTGSEYLYSISWAS